jgi:ABC-type multidrug transport system fused ATPase/permease subunit
MIGLEMGSMILLAPIVDTVLNTDLKEAGSITRKIMTIFSFIGIRFSTFNIAVILLILVFFKSGFAIWSSQMLVKTRYALGRDLISESFESYFKAQWFFFSGNKQGNLINTFTREIGIVITAFSVMGVLFSYIIQIGFYLVLPFYISWQVSSICFLICALFVSPLFMLGKLSHRFGKEATATSNILTSSVNESLGLAKIIMGFSNQRTSINKLISSFDANKRVAVKTMVLGEAIGQVFFPLGIMVLMIALFAGKSYSLPLSELTVLVYSLFRIVPMFGKIAQQKHSIDNFFPSYEQILSYKRQAEKLVQSTGSRVYEGINKGISIEDISFNYPGSKPVLKDIKLYVPKGKMVAIVGESGVGKSTLIDLLIGLNKPSSGQIKIDGVLLQDYDINSYRSKIGYIPQDSTLFDMTIADNVRWANGVSSDAEIKKACQMANADKFIEEFPKGYNTFVGDRGVRLSGGQIQRIALARAIIRAPDILFMDEATSNLDTQSERLIQETIDKIAENTTIVIIAHRLSTIINSDYIYVLEKGRVVEEGVYSELITKNGCFKKMIDIQRLKKEQFDVSDISEEIIAK